MQLAGYLNFLTRALNFGRTFLRSLYNQIKPYQLKLDWHIPVGEQVKEDLAMWETFLRTEPFYKTFVEVLELPAAEVQWYTDAAGSADLGFCCYLNGKWMYGQWPPGLINQSISTCFLELFALVLSVVKWARLFQGKCVVIHCDNQAAVWAVNKCTSRCQKCLDLLRHFAIACMTFNFCCRAVYIPTEENIIADSLSRFNFQKFCQSVHGTQLQRELPPKLLWPMPQRLLMQ